MMTALLINHRRNIHEHPYRHTTLTTCEMFISVYWEDVLKKFYILAQVPLVHWSRADTHDNKVVDLMLPAVR